MTLITITAIAVGALLVGALGFAAACFGRIARETDDADLAAWERRNARVRATGGGS
jgi:hypothetical protein